MKILLKILTLAAALFAVSVQLNAATWNDAYGIGNPGPDDWQLTSAGVPFTVVSSVQSNSVYVVSSTKPGLPTVFDDVSFKTDFCSSGAALKFYVSTNTWTISSNAPAGTNQIWLSTTNAQMATNDICVVQDVANDCYQMIIISGNATDAYGTVLTNALGEVLVKTFNTITNALTAGDKLYKMATVFNINPLTITSLTNAAQLVSSQNSTNSCFNQWLPLTVSGFNSGDRLKFRTRAGQVGLVTLTYSNAGGLLVSGQYSRKPR